MAVWMVPLPPVYFSPLAFQQLTENSNNSFNLQLLQTFDLVERCSRAVPAQLCIRGITSQHMQLCCLIRHHQTYSAVVRTVCSVTIRLPERRLTSTLVSKGLNLNCCPGERLNSSCSSSEVTADVVEPDNL